MQRILATLHVALVSTVLFPVYTANTLEGHPRIPVPWRNPSAAYYVETLPLEEAMRAFETRFWLRSVVAAGLPACLALLNLPLILMLKGQSGARWRAWSSLILGFLSTTLMFQLILRYGYGREWGGIVIWCDSLLLLIAGTAATARLKPAVEPLPVIRDA